jgi:hypothetical protein
MLRVVATINNGRCNIDIATIIFIILTVGLVRLIEMIYFLNRNSNDTIFEKKKS